MTIHRHLKSPLRVLAVFFLLVLLIYILFTQTNLPLQVANRVIQRLIGDKYGLKVSIGKISGSIFSDLTLFDLSVQYAVGDTNYQVVHAKQVAVGYSLSDLWFRKWVIKRLSFDSLEVLLPPGLKERLSGPEQTQGSRQPFNFKIEHGSIRNGQLKYYSLAQPTIVRNLDFSFAFSRSGDTLSLRIDSSRLIYAAKNIDVSNFQGKLILTDSILEADSVQLRVLGSFVNLNNVSANLRNLNYALQMQESNFNLNEIGKIFGVNLIGDLRISGDLAGDFKKISGDVTVDGSLYRKTLKKISTKFDYIGGLLSFYNLKGGAFSSILTGDGTIDFKSVPNEYLFSGKMDNFSLNSLVDHSFKTSFSGEVIVEGKSFSGKGFVINLKAELGKGFFDVYQFDSVYGYADVYLDSIVFSEPLQLDYQGAHLEATGKINYLHDLSLTGTGTFPDLTPLTDITLLKNIYGRGEGDFTFYGPTANPHLSARFHSDSVRAFDVLTDDLDIDLYLDRFVLYSQGDLNVKSGPFHYGRFGGDSILARVLLDSNLISVDSLRLYSPKLSSQLNLEIETRKDLSHYRIPEATLTVDTFQVKNVDTVLFTIGADSSWTIDRLKLESEIGNLEVSGKYAQSGAISFAFACSHANLTPILEYYVPGQGLTGIADLTATLAGTTANPKITAQGLIDSIQLRGQNYGLMHFSVDYHDSALIVDSLVLKGGNILTNLSGTFPINLAFENVPDRFNDNRSMDLRVDSRTIPLILLPLILPDIEWVEGKNQLNLKIVGSPKHPEFAGDFKLENGQVKVYYLENVLNNVNADVSFKGRDIILNKITATAKSGTKIGSAELTGVVSLERLLKPSTEVKLTAQDFPFKYDLGEIKGVIDRAEIAVSGQDTITATGQVSLLSFEYGESFVPVIQLEALANVDTLNRFNYILDISAPANLQIVNQDFNAELGGELQVIKQGNFQNFLGTLTVIRGKYYFYDQNFTIIPGGEITFDDIKEFDPKLNLTLETNITDRGERLKARLLLSGTLLEPKLTATEDSEVGENQFFEWLSFQRFVSTDTAGSPFAGRLQRGASEIAISKASQYLAGRIGVETFEINPYDDKENFNLPNAELRIGLYTLPSLYIYGATRLNFEKAQDMGFEYRLSRHFFFSGQKDKNNLYNLNMNLNWEF